MREFPAAGYRRRLLFPGIRPDTTRGVFQMHPYPDRNRRCARKSNTANVSATSGARVRRNQLEAERLGFTPASGYKYSGEHEACKVASEVARDFSTALRARRNDKRYDKQTQHRFCPARLFAERWRRSVLKTPRGRGSSSRT